MTLLSPETPASCTTAKAVPVLPSRAGVAGDAVLLCRAGAHARRCTLPPCPALLRLCNSLPRVCRHHKHSAVGDLLCCQVSSFFHPRGKAGRSSPALSSNCPVPHLCSTSGNSAAHVRGQWSEWAGPALGTYSFRSPEQFCCICALLG